MRSRRDRDFSHLFLTCLATLIVALNGAVARADETIDAIITVRATTGFVTVVSDNASRTPSVGETLTTPATIETGPGSSLQIEQGTTILEIGPDTRLTIPAASRSWITRIIHSIGNVLYRIERREGREFSVETPYLVSVVKGTEFNVLVGDASATVSLFEGSLEVLGAQSSLLLAPGDVAMFSRGDSELGVIRGLGSEPVGLVTPGATTPGVEFSAPGNAVPLRADMPDLFTGAGFGAQDVSVTNLSHTATRTPVPVTSSVTGAPDPGTADPNAGSTTGSGSSNVDPGIADPGVAPGVGPGTGNIDPGVVPDPGSRGWTRWRNDDWDDDWDDDDDDDDDDD